MARNGKKITSAHNTEQTKKETIQMLRTIIVLTQSLQPLPDNVMMTMKILYYDEGKLDFFYLHGGKYHLMCINLFYGECVYSQLSLGTTVRHFTFRV